MHSRLDLNLLVALDALLEAGSVNGAAARLHLSGPAMSRALARVRRALSDPILVRSGRAMAPTPYALAIRAEVRELVERAGALFTGPRELDLSTLDRTFTVQADDSILPVGGAALLQRLRERAPNVSLRFLPEGPTDTAALRDGSADLEIGVVTGAPPETRTEVLLHEDNVAVVREGHPLARGPVTVEAYAAADHLTIARRGRLHGPIDEGLAALGLSRRVVTSAPTFSAALLMVAGTDLVGRAARGLHRPLVDRLGLAWFEIPVPTPRLPISQAWHPRLDADPAHRWLRTQVREAFAALAAA